MLKYFRRVLKVKATLGSFLDFTYFSSYLKSKETAWKRGQAIFLEQEMLWSSLGQFWKVLIEIKQIKILMPVSLTPKNLGPLNFIESSHENLVPTKFHSYSMSRSRVTVCFISQRFLWNQYAIPLQALELYRLEPIYQSFHKDILLSKVSLATSWPIKGNGLFNF